MPYLFLFTVGPVQSFIAQARKTQDLYAGSLILSDLIKVAINVIGKDKIIFPNPNSSSLPNRFIAKLDIDIETDLSVLGKEVEEAVRKKWKSIASKSITNLILCGNTPNAIDCEKMGINQQIDTHLDIQWLFEKIALNTDSFSSGNDYKDTFERIERYMGGLKNLRSFTQFNYDGLGEKGRKCSLDGFRNVKFYRESKKQNAVSINSNIGTGYKKDNKTTIRNNFLFSDNNCIFPYESQSLTLNKQIKRGEGLSAVSLTKRLYSDKEFESTADIALLDWLSFFKENHAQDFIAYKNQFSENFNTQLFYEDNLNEDYFDKEGLNLEQDFNNLKIKLREIIGKAKDAKITQKKYYAILAFDGDSMGKWLSGDNLEDANQLEAFHKALSTQLGCFAEFAKLYLDDENRGRTVYAGGDDFLGFVNLESLFDVLSHLHAEFKKTVNDELKSIFSFKEHEILSFSAGVCIAHYKEPLSLVLSRARTMQDKAKDARENKNAFGISVIKGSGEESEMIWGFDAKNISRISYLLSNLLNNTFSNSFSKNIQILFERTLDISNFEISDNLYELFAIELERLIGRSFNLSVTIVR